METIVRRRAALWALLSRLIDKTSHVKHRTTDMCQPWVKHMFANGPELPAMLTTAAEHTKLINTDRRYQILDVSV